MAQSNVAREPSMDEILASIRKIIESNEPGMPGFPANDVGKASDTLYAPDDTYEAERDDDIHLTIDDDVLVAEFEANVAERTRTFEQMPREPHPEPAKSATSPSTPPMSLADVAARVRAASERNTYLQREPETLAPTRSQPESPMVTARMAPVPAARSAGAGMQDPAEERPSPQRVEIVSVTALQPSQALRPENIAAATDTGAQPPPAVERQRQASAVPADKVTSPLADKDTTTIVSPAVGQQVARSFDDLAFAMDSSARRSFDDIAEDMLRPMLQEWLDDNLPTLVERLVREEIERVARGPRR